MASEVLDVFTFGETMLRLMPPGAARLEAATTFEVHVGGAESNVAVALARLGKHTAWMSRLPSTPIGQIVANAVRAHDVDVSSVIWVTGERLGTYYLEHGSAPRAARVWYDRAESAASRLSPADLPLDRIRSARWLHVTGITPALSASCLETVRTALEYARANGVHASLDVNYRSLLWTAEVASQALEPLCHLADVVFVAQRDALALFGTDDPATLRDRWDATVIQSRGADGAVGCDNTGVVEAASFPVTVIERLGAGDAFAAGVICLLLEDRPLLDALRFGCAAAALKLTMPGDFALISRPDVEQLLVQGSGGSIRR